MKKVSKVLSVIVLVILGVITIFPFIYMILGGLMSHSEVTSIPPTIIPHELRWHNYIEVFQKAPFLQYFFNTVLTATITTVATLITAVLAAFALTQLEFKGKKFITVFLVSLLMVPSEATIFTNYDTIAQMGLLNTYIALFLPFLTSIFYTYYLVNYFNGISKTYYQAAKIDGASNLEYIWKILIPMCRPALTTVGLLTFISSWNAFLWPLLVTNESKFRLLNNGLSAFTTESGSEVQLQLAAATLTVLPILIIYLIFHKQIIKGVAKDGIKG